MENNLHCGRFVLSLKTPLIMGIVNLTDDSFSGDGLGADVANAIAHGWRMVGEGAHILDIGAESSRPAAVPVSLQQELDRVLPVIEGLRSCGVPLSVDTVKPEVMKAALDAGADMINDINALQAPGALEAVAGSHAAVCLMHMRGDPATMQSDPRYDDVVVEVRAFLADRVATAKAAGIALDRIVIDPGFGFGKTFKHNLVLLRQLDKLHVARLPLMVGLSRKSMLGLLTGQVADQRLYAGIAAALLALQRGACIVRVHDVAPLRDALAVWNAVENIEHES